jgi:ubiquinone/menaquinone biosynthesis C-methylase UbiE
MNRYLYDSAYLDTVYSLFADTKRRSYELLRISPGDRIFEIGCGNGKDAAALAEMGATVLGIDCHEEFLRDAARLMCKGLRLDFLCSEADCIDRPDESADKIRFDRVFQHLTNPKAVLSEAKRLLKSGGKCQVIDVDYFGMTIFPCDAALERTVVDSVARVRYPNAHNVRALPTMLSDTGFVVTEIEVRPFVVDDYSTGKFLIRFDTVVDQLLRSGQITTTQHAIWQRYEESIEATFRLTIPQIIFMASKP